jgi:2-keto-3-deoxy-L-rhamnonate aldolase RhmA
VKWALDSGAAGIVVPMVQNKEEAAEIVRFARYPPHGQRSFGPFHAPWADLSEDSDVTKYFTRTAKEISVITMIESVIGIQNAEEIMATKGISGIFIGPVDLRLSMGFSRAAGDETEYVQALEKIVCLGQKLAIPIGIFSATPDVLKAHIKMGFTFFLVAGDTTALVQGATAAVEGAHRAIREIKL